MGYMMEYLFQSEEKLKQELRMLISKYNKKRGTYLFIYAAAVNKTIPDVAMNKDDYYTFFDCLNDEKSENIDVLLETPGGSGDAAEEIAKFLHKKFNKINFLIPGEAKSAGTILALSGHDILMTSTGSLGPIDAQVRIGRTYISAYDYMEWVREKKKEADEKKQLNPFDAIMVAQISPGELKLVNHLLKYAEDLVIQWLPNYKFGDWVNTETRGIPVTPEMKQKRAKDIAETLTNHSKWRSHGRSIKIDDLERDVQLRITQVDQDPELSEMVYRIHTIIRLIFAKGSSYKIFACEKMAIVKAAELFNPTKGGIQKLDPNSYIVVDVTCPKCKKKEGIYLKLENNSKIDKVLQDKDLKPYPTTGVLKCICGNDIDLNPLREDIEQKTGKKVVVGGGHLIWRIEHLFKKLKKNS